MAGSPLLHIGFHKTGTNWLQQHAFTRDAKLGLESISNEPDIKTRVVAPHDLDFDPAACRASFAQEIERARGKGRVPVISAERLCGDFSHGGYDSARIAERLASVWPDGRVLMVIREQREMVFSSYRQYVKMGGLLALEGYLRQPMISTPHPWPFVLPHLQYDRLIAYYHRLYGAANVLVLPFELFRDEPEEFLRRLTTFAGAKPARPGKIEKLPFHRVVNEGGRPAAIPIERRMNRLVRRRLNLWAPLDADSPAGRRLDEAAARLARMVPHTLATSIEDRMRATVADAIGDRYRESNARSAALTGLDLAQYGYDLAEGAAAAPAVENRVAERVG